MKKNSGLSLVELLVAIAVFSIIMLVVSGIVIQGLQVRRDSQLDTRAQAYANAVLEQYKNHWSNQGRYAAASLPTLPEPPAGFADIAQIDIQPLCVYLDGTAPTPSCTTTPPLRRVSVSLTDSEGKVRANLVTEIGAPRP